MLEDLFVLRKKQVLICIFCKEFMFYHYLVHNDPVSGWHVSLEGRSPPACLQGIKIWK
jgi:hypothetical protein